MVDLEQLNKAIKDSGLKLGHLAKLLGVSRTTLWKKLHGDVAISLHEANIIASAIDMTKSQKLSIFLP